MYTWKNSPVLGAIELETEVGTWTLRKTAAEWHLMAPITGLPCRVTGGLIGWVSTAILRPDTDLEDLTASIRKLVQVELLKQRMVAGWPLLEDPCLSA